MDRKVKKVNWKNPLEETKEFEETEIFLNNPTYVLNIIYIINENNIGIYLSRRTQKSKEMYNMWQSSGGKVEKGESSAQVALRETLEETGIQLKENDIKYLFNDARFNCDVYVTQLRENQVPQQTEPQKQGLWKLVNLEDYEQLAVNGKTTSTHTTHLDLIKQGILGPQGIGFFHQSEYAQDALFGDAIICGYSVNVLLDSGAVGCIVSKHFLDEIGKDINTPVDAKIVDINGKRTSPLGIVYNVPVQVGKIETFVDMIVTESREYNVLLGNTWLKLVKANIKYCDKVMDISY